MLGIYYYNKHSTTIYSIYVIYNEFIIYYPKKKKKKNLLDRLFAARMINHSPELSSLQTPALPLSSLGITHDRA